VKNPESALAHRARRMLVHLDGNELGEEDTWVFIGEN
jgi:hypothetical protein